MSLRVHCAQLAVTGLNWPQLAATPAAIRATGATTGATTGAPGAPGATCATCATGATGATCATCAIPVAVDRKRRDGRTAEGRVRTTFLIVWLP